jgi:hypothetical protein
MKYSQHPKKLDPRGISPENGFEVPPYWIGLTPHFARPCRKETKRSKSWVSSSILRAQDAIVYIDLPATDLDDRGTKIPLEQKERLRRPGPCQISSEQTRLTVGMCLDSGRSCAAIDPDRSRPAYRSFEGQAGGRTGDYAEPYRRLDFDSDPNDQFQLVRVLSGNAASGDIFEFTPAKPLTGVQFIRVVATSCSAWVGWRGIEDIAPRCDEMSAFAFWPYLQILTEVCRSDIRGGRNAP